MESMWIPLDPADVPSLEALLSRTDPFVTTTIDTKRPYSLSAYLEHTALGRAELRALLDRNLVSKAISLAAGGRIDHAHSGSETARVAAAAMAFLVTANVLIEPSIALYELAESVGPRQARAQLRAWRVADNVHPQAYLDVALSRADRIAPVALHEARAAVAKRLEREPAIEPQVRHWRSHRLVLSQIALLDRSELRPAEKMHMLLDWSVDEAFLDGVATCFAIAFFGSRRPRGMLQGVRSASLERCLKSIRNAAWDLAYVSYWEKYARDGESDKIWIFCTFDRLLGQLARAAVGDRDGDTEAAAGGLFRANWSTPDAEALFAHYKDVLSRAEPSPEREAVVRHRLENIDDLTLGTERELAATFGQRSEEPVEND